MVPTMIDHAKFQWITAQELEVRSLNHPYSLKTKSSQCHYVVILWAFVFEATGVIKGSNFKLLWLLSTTVKYGRLCYHRGNSLPTECRLLINFANSLDLDQARQNIGPDLDPIFLTPRWYSWKKLILKKKISSRQTCADTENFVRGGPTLTT